MPMRHAIGAAFLIGIAGNAAAQSAEIIVQPALAGAFATGVAYWETERAADPCKPPAIRMESANIAALPGPNSPASKEALKSRAAEEEKKKALKTEKSP
jgi:hypothetical protein